MLILCGSVTSMMHRETLSASAPLYGRASASILLKPLQFSFLGEFFDKSEDTVGLVEFYSLCGGVPRYINLARNYASHMEALEELVLSPEGILYSEAKNILRDEISVPNVCWSILNAIASGSTRISELGSRLSLPANQLTRYIDLLIDLQLVRRMVPVLEANPHKSKKGVYSVCDPFFRLWFGTIYPYESFLEMGNSKLVLQRIGERLVNHVASCYEDICTENVMSNMQAYGCLRIGRQWAGDYEIDIAGVDEQGRLALAGECKWTGKKVGISLLNELKEKITSNSLPVSDDCRYLLFSKSGFSNDLIEQAKHDSAIVLRSL